MVAERGRKGNFFGALQAYSDFSACGADHLATLRQIVMLVGSGTRLSPFTQSLGNMKSGFPVPDGEMFADDLSIGESAVYSSRPIVEALDQRGFSGLVIRWGDEVQIASIPLTSASRDLSQSDAVRFGWRTDPTDLIATQKDWFLADANGVVVHDIPRQPIDSLRREFARVSDKRSSLTAYVNLGSLAASHTLLGIASRVFATERNDLVSAANWDPYFWTALQCHTREEWDSVRARELAEGHDGIARLEEVVPSFYGKVREVLSSFESQVGRPIRVSVMDFGEPYWFDFGNHDAMQEIFSDIFSSSERGRTVRAFLALPETLASGGSFVQDSHISPGVSISNSIVLGSEIRHPKSRLDGAIVVNARYDYIDVGKGGSVIHSSGNSLVVGGPHGMAFRLLGTHVLQGQERAATLLTESGPVHLRYDNGDARSLDEQVFVEALAGNPVSFKVASEMMDATDPSDLDKYWRSLVMSQDAR